MSTWTAQGLRRKTQEHRLYAFEQVGGANATFDSIVAWLNTLPAPSTRRSRRSDVQATFRLLVAGGVLERDPSVLVPRVRVPRWMPRPLTDDEVELVMAAADDELRDMLTLALYAGLRAAEIAGLRGEHLECHHGQWSIRVVGKGDAVGVIPAHPKVMAIMQGRRGFIFPGATPNSVSHKALYLFKQLGLDGGIHRCRHTFATRALEASNESLLVVRDLLRHSSVATTQVYAQLRTDRLYETMLKIA